MMKKCVFVLMLYFFSTYASATLCEEGYSALIGWSSPPPANASLLPADGSVPINTGMLQLRIPCQGGYKIDGYINYDGITNLSAEGIYYRLYLTDGTEIPVGVKTHFQEVPQNGTGSKPYVINYIFTIKLFRSEPARRGDWSGSKDITLLGNNLVTVHSGGGDPDANFSVIIPTSPTMSVKVDRCQMVNNTQSVDLGSVKAGEEGEYVSFQIDLANCPARTNPAYWGMRVFIDDPNSSQSNTNLLRPAVSSVIGYGVAVDVSDNGNFKPVQFNTGDTFTPITLSDYDPNSRATSINLRAILKRNGDPITVGLFQATGNVRIVFE